MCQLQIDPWVTDGARTNGVLSFVLCATSEPFALHFCVLHRCATRSHTLLLSKTNSDSRTRGTFVGSPLILIFSVQMLNRTTLGAVSDADHQKCDPCFLVLILFRILREITRLQRILFLTTGGHVLISLFSPRPSPSTVKTPRMPNRDRNISKTVDQILERSEIRRREMRSVLPVGARAV